MTAELLSSLAGIILSLSMRYLPGLKGWYGGLSSTAKQLFMAVLLVVAAFVSAVWTCSDPAPSVSRLGSCLGGTDWREYVRALVAALVSNQATHQITPKVAVDDTQKTTGVTTRD